MIIQRRNFLIGLASSLAAPAIVRAASIMPVKVFRPNISMQVIEDYLMYEQCKLDVLYGSLRIGDAVKFSCLDDEFKITAISASELYHDR